ncbi:hypothetical protein SAMN06297129_0018 [Pseudooceanicola antarcticus]|uniref:Uncharacterized protein n=1 Tax=Pseudooceanicola antarcticus TaxID=1247613 RepID=A0A285HI94_9RHOB|nr:hypothetical protein [Pseudooceanicola antarcticus]PJE27994.1 hypothetical protein CVM39_15685 [Pseudooceanicola antarcticus]SNY35442.1 hypothetical protein SAMN06297129_0018 [Pseudooceanicola antarcticus]
MKALAILNVLSWASFWCFGLIAVFADLSGSEQLAAALLSGAGFLGGMLAHLGLCNRIGPRQRIAPQSEV